MASRQFDTLYDRYPQIFQDRPISCGITCGEGWYSLIDDLCDRIQKHIATGKAPQVQAIQVKEKFGELRFYYRGGDAAIRGMVDAAEKHSTTVCEICGAPGSLHGVPRGWWRTRCEEHVDTPT